MTDTVNNQIPFVPENTLDPAAGLNAALQVIDALLQLTVLAIQNDPPVSPADGDRYIVGVGSGAWAGQDDLVAMWIATGSYWQFRPARIALNLADGYAYARTGAGWAILSGAITGPIVNTTAEKVRGVPRDVTANISGGALVIDYNNGDHQIVDLTAAGAGIVFTVANMPVGGVIKLVVKAGNTNTPDVSAFTPVLNEDTITFGGPRTTILIEADEDTTPRFILGGYYTS